MALSTSGTSPTAEEINVASSVKERHAGALMARGGILGVGVGVADDDATEAVIVLYVDQARRPASLPNALDGVRVKVVPTDPIVAFSGVPISQ